MHEVSSVTLRDGKIVHLTTVAPRPFGPFYSLPEEDIARVTVFLEDTQ